MDGTGRASTVVGTIIVAILQIVVAPNIALFAAVPNFMLAYVVVVALVRADTCGYVMPFVLGLLYDLVGGGPVGGMALLFVLATFLISRAFMVLNNDTLFMPLVLLVVSVLVIEVLYGLIVMACGLSASIVDAFVYRSLPCALYDCVLSLIIYPLALRFLVRPDASAQTPLVG